MSIGGTAAGKSRLLVQPRQNEFCRRVRPAFLGVDVETLLQCPAEKAQDVFRSLKLAAAAGGNMVSLSTFASTGPAPPQ